MLVVLAVAGIYVTAAHADGGPPVDIAPPTIIGDDSAAGNVLTVDPGQWIGATAFTYVWNRCNSESGCNAIPGATAATYTITDDDLGSSLDVLVTAVNAAGSSAPALASLLYIAGAPELVTFPYFDFTTLNTLGYLSLPPAVGDTLTADPGTYLGSPSVSIQWERCSRDGVTCDPIDGATEMSYQVKDADHGSVLAFQVAAANVYGSYPSTVSTLVPVGEPVATIEPTIDGDVGAVGATLRLNTGTWLNADSLTEQWQRCTPAGDCSDIDGATDTTYVVQSGDLGRYFVAKVTASDDVDSVTETAESTVVGAPVELTAPLVTGDPSGIGDTLKVSSGTWSGARSFEYQWYRCRLGCTAIPNAVKATYKLVVADAGATIYAAVTAVGGAGSETDDADASGIAGYPANTAAPKIGIKTVKGVTTLTVANGTWKHTTSFTYEWSRCSVVACETIDGATTASYRATPADYGEQLLVYVTGHNAYGSLRQFAEASLAVGLVKAPVFKGTVMDGSIPLGAIGNRMSITPGQWTGNPTVTFTWERCTYDACTPIGGATANTYTTGVDDLGDWNEVLVTATGALGTAQLEYETVGVVGTPYLTRSDGAITGVAQVGSTLTITNDSGWNGAQPMTFGYQWYRCSRTCTAIDGAVNSTYRIGPSDARQRLAVQISATNQYGEGFDYKEYETAAVKAAAQPVVASFAPLRGAVGDPVTINGSHFTGVTSVSFAGTPAAFTVQSDKKITTNVPADAADGPISVYSPVGSTTSRASFVIPADADVTSFAPTVGKAGTAVTVGGTGFADASKVTFAGKAARFKVLSNTQIVATAPTTTTGPIVVTNPQGSATSASDFVVLARPTIQSLSPAAGASGDPVTITGTNFTAAPDAGTVVKFGRVPADAVVTSPTTIDTSVPDGAVSAKVTVTDVAGTATSPQVFQASQMPAITSVTPGAGAIGTRVVIAGKNLAGATDVSFGGVDATFTATATRITTTVPFGAASGPIAVTTPGGDATTANDFVVPAAPRITDVTTPSGTAAGDPVTVAGSGFDDVDSVTIGGVAAAFDVASDHEIDTTIPVGVSGSVPIVVTNPEGDATSELGVTAAPQVASFSPAKGTAGTAVTITGSGFTGAVLVTFAGSPATFTVDSDTQITAPVPLAAVSGPIAVTNDAGVGTSATSFTPVPATSITSFSPASAHIGDTVTITGVSLDGVTSVDFDGGAIPAEFTIDSSTQISAVVPVGAEVGPLFVQGTFGSAYSPDVFTAIAPPTVTGWAPQSGPAGTVVDFYGTYLGGTTSVDFNGAAAEFTIVSINEVTAVVPDDATSGPVQIITAGGQALPGDYTVVEPLSLTSFTPESAAAGATVTLTGTNFDNVVAVHFGAAPAQFTAISNHEIQAVVPNDVADEVTPITVADTSTDAISTDLFTFLHPPSITDVGGIPATAGSNISILGTGFSDVTEVDFNGAPATSFTILAPDAIEAIAPASATPGPIHLTNGEGDATSSQDFTEVPTVAGVTQPTAAAGDTIAITGTYFDNIQQVLVGGTPAEYDVVSPDEIDAVVPDEATSGDVSVEALYGNSIKTGAFTLVFKPVISSFTPSGGAPGTQVTITGTAFTGATQVDFDGVPASAFTVDSDSQITATSPDAATGKITVETAVAIATSTDDFTGVPEIASFAPTSAKPGDSVTITGTGLAGATAVTLDGATASFTVNSSEQITATVPADADSGQFEVDTPFGTAQSSDSFHVLHPATIDSFAPTSGYVGDTIEITGTHFDTSTEVDFDGTQAAFTIDSPAQISATVPGGAASGAITVTNEAGETQSAGTFHVLYAATVASFSPTGGKAGATVTITGTHFIDATAVAFGGAPADFTVDSDTQITATVPSEATTGPISVTNGAGLVSSDDSFAVFHDATIDSFSPTNGVVGASVTITGTNFDSTELVDFDGTPAAFTVDSATQITATVPDGAASGPIGVTNLAGLTVSGGTFHVLYPATIESFSPTSGGVGATVTITGSHFIDATSVAFGGTAATGFQVDSDAQITVAVPIGAATGAISVVNGYGEVDSTDPFTVISLPTVDSFAPTSGSPGDSIVIQGTNLTGATDVDFNGVPADFTVPSDTEIDAVVPSGNTAGRISVTTPGGTAQSTGTFTGPPAIMSFAPTSAHIGDHVALAGGGFTGTSEVDVNGFSASFSVVSDSEIDLVVPVGATEGAITLQRGDGATATSSSALLVLAPPVIESLSPSHAQPGEGVTITGHYFTDVTEVDFGSVASPHVVVLSEGSLIATVPDTAEDGPVTVRNAEGDTQGGDFTVDHQPTIDSFTPTSGRVGDTIEITGTYLDNAAVLNLGNYGMEFTVVSSTEIDAVVPNHATSAQIALVSNFGTVARSADAFNVLPTPDITGFSPEDAGVGDTVVISGSRFTGATAVEIGGASADFTVVSDTEIDAVVPVNVGLGLITVTTSEGTGTSDRPFMPTYETPVIDSFAPTSGIPGDTIVVTGRHFGGTNAVEMAGTLHYLTPDFTVVSDSEIDVVVPKHVATGPITIVSGSGESVDSDDFTAVPIPDIVAISPASGAAGVSVAIDGSRFTGTTAVTFDGVSAGFTVDSDTRITATVPDGASTGKVVVTNASGTGTSDDDFVIGAAPTVGGFSPSSAPIGATIDITGTGFTGATGVYFGALGNWPATSFTVVSDTDIQAVVPDGASPAQLYVATAYGSAHSTDYFTTIKPPTVTSLTPNSGAVGDTIQVNGYNFTGVTEVDFNGTPCEFTFVNPGELTATVPDGAASGPVKVIDPAGYDDSQQFTVTG
jgi:hypothetical protein